MYRSNEDGSFRNWSKSHYARPTGTLLGPILNVGKGFHSARKGGNYLYPPYERFVSALFRYMEVVRPVE